jgi:hypothetical protein
MSYGINQQVGTKASPEEFETAPEPFPMPSNQGVWLHDDQETRPVHES